MKPYFGRLITAMITFFHEDGSLNAEGTAEFASWLVDHGSDAILVAGTSGEAPTLTYDEKKELFTAVINKLGGRAPVIVGTGSNDTAQTLLMNKLAEEVGADGVLVVGPFYNKPSQEGFYQHFKTVAEHTQLPILVYNVPGRTGSNIKPLTMARLVKDCPNIVGIKEAAGNVSQVAELYRIMPENFSIYSGDDGLTLPFFAVGCAGRKCSPRGDGSRCTAGWHQPFGIRNCRRRTPSGNERYIFRYYNRRHHDGGIGRS